MSIIQADKNVSNSIDPQLDSAPHRHGAGDAIPYVEARLENVEGKASGAKKMNNRTHDEFPSPEREKKRVELYFGLRPPAPRPELEGQNNPTNELNEEPKKSSAAARLVARWKAEGRIKPTKMKQEPQQPGQMLPPKKQQDEEVECGHQASRSPAMEELTWRRKVRISRRTILALYGISVATSCLWVPWTLEFPRTEFLAKGVYFIGYNTPWSPPKLEQIRSHVPNDVCIIE